MDNRYVEARWASLGLKKYKQIVDYKSAMFLTDSCNLSLEKKVRKTVIFHEFLMEFSKDFIIQQDFPFWSFEMKNWADLTLRNHKTT